MADESDTNEKEVIGDVPPVSADEIYAAYDASRAEFVTPDTCHALHARIAELEKTIIYAASAYNLDGSQDDILAAETAIVRMSHEGARMEQDVIRALEHRDAIAKRAAQAEADALKFALYIASRKHDDMCAAVSSWTPRGECDCGFDAAREYLDANGAERGQK